jgi:lysophospholipase L1-like esterase
MLTYLALGDSYTIGELVPLQENFPFQTVQLLREQGVDIADPVIIATTGWTTDELAAAIREKDLKETFSIVTLLIGVNNQYRGRSLENYVEEFTSLLTQAIAFAGGKKEQVIVLSIPDWGVTPFAHDRDGAQIAKEIDAYNQAKKRITAAHGCHFIEITESTRTNGTNPDYLVSDELHPSAKEYAVWAERLISTIESKPFYKWDNI